MIAIHWLKRNYIVGKMNYCFIGQIQLILICYKMYVGLLVYPHFINRIAIIRNKAAKRSNDRKSHEDFHSWTKNKMSRKKTNQTNKQTEKWTLLALLENCAFESGGHFFSFISEEFYHV